MIVGSCHCGAVRFELAKTPEWLTACNCSICRRLGALWAYGDASEVRVIGKLDATSGYVWGDRTLLSQLPNLRLHDALAEPAARSIDPDGVNCRLADPQAIAKLRIRRFDGADSWVFLD